MSDTLHPIWNILITVINDESPYKAPTISQEWHTVAISKPISYVTSKRIGIKTSLSVEYPQQHGI